MSVLFLSGYPALTPENFVRVFNKCPGRLLSMHKSYHEMSKKWKDTMVANEIDCSQTEVMFDSGAFTAWNRKEPRLDVHELLKRYKGAARKCDPLFKKVWFISLDVIPGEPGRTPTKEEVTEAVKLSDENHKVLRDVLGDRVIPVFHQGEHPDRLREVREINPTYICISPQNELHEKARWEWARLVHYHLEQEEPIRTHGLATTGGEMMETIEWRSVDSASWLMIGAYGSVVVNINGKLRTFATSKDTPIRRNLHQHMDSVTNLDVKEFVRRMCDKLNLDRTALFTNVQARYIFNVHVMREWSQRPLKMHQHLGTPPSSQRRLFAW